MKVEVSKSAGRADQWPEIQAFRAGHIESGWVSGRKAGRAGFFIKPGPKISGRIGMGLRVRAALLTST